MASRHSTKSARKGSESTPDLANFWNHIVMWLGQNIQGPMALAAVIQAVAAVVGFLFIIIQLRAATQDRLYAHYLEICKLFMQNPELRPYCAKRRAQARIGAEGWFDVRSNLWSGGARRVAEVVHAARRLEALLAPVCPGAPGKERGVAKILRSECALVLAQDAPGDEVPVP
jgi:hypothetical protein